MLHSKHPFQKQKEHRSFKKMRPMCGDLVNRSKYFNISLYFCISLTYG